MCAKKQPARELDEDLIYPVGTADSEFDNCIDNMEIVKRKLELFLEEEDNKQGNTSVPINVSTSVVNNNSNDVSISISFEQAREQIENMTALSDNEVEEILSKLNDIEKIVQSKDRRTKKWEDAKEIIRWIADKGVDVGITLLPLLLQI